MAASNLSISSLKFEHHPTGLGISVSKPRLSWTVVPTGGDISTNWLQKSYEIQIKRHSSTDVETFRRDGDNTVLVPWPDTPLESAEAARVRVRSLGQSGTGEQHTEWSIWQVVEASILKPTDWTGKTITAPANTSAKHADEAGIRPVLFRKTFTVVDAVPKSRLYITALGLYEAYLNGQRIGNECLAPGWTSYQYRIQFQVFDVGPLMVTGENILVVEVAEGWYAGRLLWKEGIRNLYGEHIGVLAQLDLFEADGSTTPSLRVQTDETWESAPSPIVASGIYDGETYDLGLKSDATDMRIPWSPVRAIETPKSKLVASSSPPVRVTQTLNPVAISKDPEGKTLIDFGQNLVGRVRIPSLSKPDGHRVIIRFAEVLEHGRLGTRPLRAAKATDTIIFGGGRELKDWYPKYTYHGFRYIEVTGWSPEDAEPLTLRSLHAEVLHTEMERTGFFSCSDENVNQLHKNAVWSMRGNFVGLPTDCPQRDERLGWTGDIQVFSPTASYLYDSGGMLANWMVDVLADQRDSGGIVPLVVPNAMKHGPWPAVPQAVWDDVVILVPWTLYNNFGDKDILEESWEGMNDYLRTLRRGDDGLWDPSLWQLGDWLDPNAPPSEPGLARTDGVLVADEYLVHVTSVMAKIANVLGLPSEASTFDADHCRLKQVFEDKYMARSGLIIGDSQTSLALALVFNLHSHAKARQVAGDRLARLVKYAKFRVSTGFAGTPVILDALTQGGHPQVAYRMLLEEGNPSWLYPVTKGATTIWERWDSMLEDGSINPGEMTSFNHYALGSVANWLHGVVGGISPIGPGWKKFLVKPIPGGTLTSAAVRFRSPNGEIHCSWTLGKDKTVRVKVKVPPNTTAVVEKPGGTRTEAGSGQHEFEWQVPHGEAWPPKPLLTEFRDLEY